MDLVKDIADEALPALASIGCEIFWNALQNVLDIGISLIPGVGEAFDAADAGMKAAVQGARAIAKAGKGSDSFLSWMEGPCPKDKYSEKIDQIFPPLIGKPKGTKTGPKAPPKNDPPPKNPPPKDPPKKDDSKTDAPKKTVQSGKTEAPSKTSNNVQTETSGSKEAPDETDKPQKTTQSKASSHASSTLSTSKTSSTAVSSSMLCSPSGPCSGTKCPPEDRDKKKKPPNLLMRTLQEISAPIRQGTATAARMVKRAPGPWYYEYNMKYMMEDQLKYDFIVTSVRHATEGSPPSSADHRPWTGTLRNVVVSGLFGCTSLVVVSRKGAYVSHFYEHPSFTGAGSPVEQRARFKKQVLDELEGTHAPLMQALAALVDGTKYHNPAPAVLFDSNSRPQVLIVSPKRSPGSTSDDYRPLIDDLEGQARSILRGTGATFERSQYERAQFTPDGWPVWQRTMLQGNENGWREWLQEQAYGKVLVQYDPSAGPGRTRNYTTYVATNTTPALSDHW